MKRWILAVAAAAMLVAVSLSPALAAEQNVTFKSGTETARPRCICQH